jgi:hypothetical protein
LASEGNKKAVIMPFTDQPLPTSQRFPRQRTTIINTLDCRDRDIGAKPNVN